MSTARRILRALAGRTRRPARDRERADVRRPSASTTGPVTDWATDFDHTDPAWAADPFPIWDELRRGSIARTERYGGAWLPTRHRDVAAIATDPDRFSSRSVIVTPHRPLRSLAPVGVAPPVTSDPPYHAAARAMLLPAFSPDAVDRLEPATRTTCRELLAAVAGHDVVDAATAYAQHIPVRVMAALLGLPDEDGDRFRGFVHELIEDVARPLPERLGTLTDLFGYLAPHIEARRAEPGEDLISLLVHAEIDGEPLTPIHVAQTVSLLLIAGIDTTWSAIGASLWHLAATPDDQARLRHEPDLLPTAMEELLRAYAPVSMARLVRDDTEMGGCPMRADDYILLCFPAANRDPEAFERADEVVLDRQPNRHVAFGLGIHRCLGSHLARMELRVALEEWFEAVERFELADPDAVRWSAGQVRGPRTLPLRVAFAG